MALIVITIADTGPNDFDMAVQCEPPTNVNNPDQVLTAAQVFAMGMLAEATKKAGMTQGTPIEAEAAH